ncbi:hypothetical protein BJ122_10273 [Rhodopseudomonas faecalis]|uniref:Uncharacterized protein n=1 Tax=Rhodopseudomonas faecalis TaxID=99655 RepID=A0A318TPB4_9BRAD|nr:hypothetical protein [Rhodopseudomonas faecalis]PYF04848.1 hypothetical protein BJ122_10273 [Rhodopseudomonas faecalis]TAH69226.1 MAG: hypothetical protein EWM45_00250 [Rhodopseudomonas palustris]
MPRTLSRSEVEQFKAQLCAAAERLIERRGSTDFTMRELATEPGFQKLRAAQIEALINGLRRR